MFGLSVDERNKKLAKGLGLKKYDGKRYRQFLQNMEMPIKSVAKVLFLDVYDQKLVGPLNEPVASAVIPDETRVAGWQANYDAHRALHPELLEQAMQNKQMVTLKRMVNPYVDALAYATETPLEKEYSIVTMQYNDVADDIYASNRLKSFPMFTMQYGHRACDACWANPKGYGWGSLDRQRYVP